MNNKNSRFLILVSWTTISFSACTTVEPPPPPADVSQYSIPDNLRVSSSTKSSYSIAGVRHYDDVLVLDVFYCARNEDTQIARPSTKAQNLAIALMSRPEAIEVAAENGDALQL